MSRAGAWFMAEGAGVALRMRVTGSGVALWAFGVGTPARPVFGFALTGERGDVLLRCAPAAVTQPDGWRTLLEGGLRERGEWIER
jgi:hypothetical protein